MEWDGARWKEQNEWVRVRSAGDVYGMVELVAAGPVA